MPLTVQSLRAIVQSAAVRPGMYFHPTSLDTFAAMIVGFELAMQAAGVVDDFPITHSFSRWLGLRWDGPVNVVFPYHVRARYGDGAEAIVEAAKLIDQYFAETQGGA